MTASLGVGLAVAVGLAVYFVVAMLFPERF